MKIRGAPLIGIFAALAVALEANKGKSIDELKTVIQILKTTRPTAIELFWALERIEKIVDIGRKKIVEEAEAILKEGEDKSYKIAKVGASLIKNGANILTYCNTGNLAAYGIGTALGIIIYSFFHNKKVHIFVPETRPKLQGARLTAWELSQAGIPYTLITDNSIASVMDKVDIVLVGADRIAKNGDTANKIGTLEVAIIAKYYRKPFYVAAPTSSFDLTLKNGREIPIEEREEEEVSIINKKRIAPLKAKILNKAFDVTPSSLITGFITEKGIITPPFKF